MTDAELRDKLAEEYEESASDQDIYGPSDIERAYSAGFDAARANPVKREFQEAETREAARKLYGDKNLQTDIAKAGFMKGARWAWEKLNGET